MIQVLLEENHVHVAQAIFPGHQGGNQRKALQTYKHFHD